MKTEIEAKFIDVDFDEVRSKLTASGAVCTQPMRLMRRALIEPDHVIEAGRDAFLRIRDEGDKVTVTFKEFKSESLSGALEREIIVSDFDETIAIFAECGQHYRTFQESRRETWKLGETEIVLDEWPWLPPKIEIEALSEDDVMSTSETLGFEWKDAVFGSVDVVYKKQYPDLDGRGVIDVPEVRFSSELPKHFGKSI